MKDETKKRLMLAIGGASILAYAADLLYKTLNKITYANRGQCVVFQNLKPLEFIAFESFVETFIMLVFGVMLAGLVYKYLAGWKGKVPSNPLAAFVVASILPLCACTAIPLVAGMRQKIDKKTVITFLVATPLMSPVIFFTSLSMLGPEYLAVRLVASFVLALGAGLFIDFTVRSGLAPDPPEPKQKAVSCGSGCAKCSRSLGCGKREAPSALLYSWGMMVSLLPYALLAAIVTFLFSLYVQPASIKQLAFGSDIVGLVALAAVGVPLYVCSGAEAILLRPLAMSGLPLGHAITFSLASTSICVSSIILLFKVLGKRQTLALTAYIFVASILLGLATNLLLPPGSISQSGFWAGGEQPVPGAPLNLSSGTPTGPELDAMFAGDCCDVPAEYQDACCVHKHGDGYFYEDGCRRRR